MSPDCASTAASGQPLIRRRSSHSRIEISDVVTRFEQAHQDGCSQRQYAREQGVPRTTLQAWLGTKQKLDAAPELVQFFDSPVGVAFLHRLVVGMHLFFEQMGSCGLRLLSELLRRVGLSPFVASSYGSQRQLALQMEQQTLCYEQQERQRLRAQMEPRQIALVEDENFHHSKPCLVAIEPVSDFIVVERRAEHRDAASWNQAVGEGLGGLPVQVVQVTSDEAKGLDNHVRQGLGVHRNSDLFHVQHEVSKGTSGALSAKVRQAADAYDQASLQWQQVQHEQQQYQAGPGPGRPPDFAARTEVATRQLEQAQQDLSTAQAHQETMQHSIRALGEVYHPFDLRTGVAQSAAEAKTALSALFDKMRQVAHKAQLSQAAHDHIDKAARVVPNLVATLTFVHLLIRTTVAQRLGALSVPAELKRVVHKVLIPGLYLLQAARRARTAEKRHAIEQAAQQLLSTLAATARWQALSSAMQQDLRALALHCAQLFQRSSSCVEGRNGHLALRQHHLHLLSDRKLRVLTILHNYVAYRPDGTTAAQRFFGAPPADLFEFLCDRLQLPGRSRTRRRTPPLPQQSHSGLN